MADDNDGSVWGLLGLGIFALVCYGLYKGGVAGYRELFPPAPVSVTVSCTVGGRSVYDSVLEKEPETKDSGKVLLLPFEDWRGKGTMEVDRSNCVVETVKVARKPKAAPAPQPDVINAEGWYQLQRQANGSFEVLDGSTVVLTTVKQEEAWAKYNALTKKLPKLIAEAGDYSLLYIKDRQVYEIQRHGKAEFTFTDQLQAQAKLDGLVKK